MGITRNLLLKKEPNRYSENEDDPNAEPELSYIDDDDEYENVADAFDEYLDTVEFDEIVAEENE